MRRRPVRPSGRRLRHVALALYAAAVWLALVLVVTLRDSTAPSYTLALAATWWLAPSAPLLVVAVVRRRPVLVAVLLVPVLVVGATVVPHGRPAWSSPAGRAADLRVVTWNITHGAPVDDVLALAAQLRPDVLVLQEVTPDARARLAPLEARYRYHAATALQPTGPYEPGDGNVVYSTAPIVAVHRVTGLPADSRPTQAVTLSVGGRRVVVVSVHLASPCVGCPPKMVRGNPSGGTAESARVRVAEARRLARLVGGLERAGTPVVVAGDINSGDFNQPLAILRGAGLTDVHRSLAWGPGFTRGPWPGIARVDVVLVAGLRPLASSVPGRGASSHAPVVADLAWR